MLFLGDGSRGDSQAAVQLGRLPGQIAATYTDAETLSSPSFPELALDLSTVFTLPIPPAEQIDEIRESAPPYGAESPTP